MTSSTVGSFDAFGASTTTSERRRSRRRSTVRARSRARNHVGAAELDAHRQFPHALTHPGQLLPVVTLRHEPRRILHQHRAELPGLHQGSQRVDEARPHFVEGVGLEVVRVEVPLRRDVVREFVAEVAPQRGRAGRMPGEQRVRLDVHHEALRRAIDPRAGQLRGGREVVGAVDFDDREPAGIELQALLGGHRPSGIPVGLLGERLVGPRARADEDGSRSGHACQHARNRARTCTTRTRWRWKPGRCSCATATPSSAPRSRKADGTVGT